MSDLDFILGHIDDLPQVFEVREGEVQDGPPLSPDVPHATAAMELVR